MAVTGRKDRPVPQAADLTAAKWQSKVTDPEIGATDHERQGPDAQVRAPPRRSSKGLVGAIRSVPWPVTSPRRSRPPPKDPALRRFVLGGRRADRRLSRLGNHREISTSFVLVLGAHAADRRPASRSSTSPRTVSSAPQTSRMTFADSGAGPAHRSPTSRSSPDGDYRPPGSTSTHGKVADPSIQAGYLSGWRNRELVDLTTVLEGSMTPPSNTFDTFAVDTLAGPTAPVN